MISEKEFTDMMFFDGCFLLEVIALVIDDCPPYSFLSRWMTLPCWSLISRDLMLLENQIPWAVLEALMSLRPGLALREAVPPPIVISGLTQVHIANMVALERCTVDESDYGVGSYLSVLALLMSGEEDVKELRLKRIMHSVLSDRQTLDFFESLSLHLLPRDNYRYVLQRLNDYYRKRRVRVILHKFIYKNFKFILAVTSAVIFFVTILQTIFTVYPRK
uniref:Uncharacterized protein n=1 Tax=Ananas comosus var. bracteatus TaxID=296719 RepID=A0A6V7PCZ2_ANACO|nr:unnamed protein product [Ananas comosus var. bracteatus]